MNNRQDRVKWSIRFYSFFFQSMTARACAPKRMSKIWSTAQLHPVCMSLIQIYWLGNCFCVYNSVLHILLLFSVPTVYYQNLKMSSKEFLSRFKFNQISSKMTISGKAKKPARSLILCLAIGKFFLSLLSLNNKRGFNITPPPRKWWNYFTNL